MRAKPYITVFLAKRAFLLALLLIGISTLFATDYLKEAQALQKWLDSPFAHQALDAQRDKDLEALQSPKAEAGETAQQFEQRKQSNTSRIAAIQREYELNLNLARKAYDAHRAKLRERLAMLLVESAQTLKHEYRLGNYDTAAQRFQINLPFKTFQIYVPASVASSVINAKDRYELQVTQRLSNSLEWVYSDAKLIGPSGIFDTFEVLQSPVALQGSVPAAKVMIPPDLNARINFLEPSGNNLLDADEVAKIQISISNSGKGKAEAVEATFMLDNAPGVSYDRRLFFGDIAPEEILTKSINLAAGVNLGNGTAELAIDFSEKSGFPPNNIKLSFGTKSMQNPDLYIADIGVFDFNENHKIEPGEPIEISIRIGNRGTGVAKSVSAELSLNNGVYFQANSLQTINVGDIPAGGFKDVQYDIISAKTATILDLKLNIRESRGAFDKWAQPLNLAFNRVERTADQMVIVGNLSQEPRVEPLPLFSVDIEQDIPRLSPENKLRWGVIVGIENYRNVSPVRFAKRDAEFMKEYFIKVLGIKAENIYMMVNDAASLGEFKSVFDPNGWLGKNATKSENEIFIYYSGHGVPTPDGKEAFLLPYDGNPDYAALSAYSLNQLYNNLSLLPAQNITLFLDSCFSGANRDNVIILADARPVFISSTPKLNSTKLSVFSASSGSQISSAYTDMQHGLFSYYLMKGLKGEADANTDRRLSYQELQDYIGENVSSRARRMGREQDPVLQCHNAQKILLQW